MVQEFKVMAPEKLTPLHNFSLPTNLKWGNQRFLRCMKLNSNSEIVSSSDRSDSDGKQRSLKISSLKSKIDVDDDEDEEIDKLRAKIMVHYKTAAEKIEKFSVQEDESAAASRPWNLRTRRAACKAPNETGGGGGESSKLENLSLSSPKPSPQPIRLRGSTATATEKKERRKFSSSLSRDEIKEDFLMITGNNPSRRPKKRAKAIQRQLDSLLPGLWLTEVTTDTYRVPDELVETKKK